MKWEDLLDVPFVEGGDDPETGLDCWGMACEVNRRLGHALPPIESPRVGLRPPDGVQEAMEFLGSSPRDATRLGDVIASHGDKPFVAHVAVLVAPGWALTTTRRHGPWANTIWRHPCSMGVWRVRG